MNKVCIMAGEAIKPTIAASKDNKPKQDTKGRGATEGGAVPAVE